MPIKCTTRAHVVRILPNSAKKMHDKHGFGFVNLPCAEIGEWHFKMCKKCNTITAFYAIVYANQCEWLCDVGAVNNVVFTSDVLGWQENSKTCSISCSHKKKTKMPATRRVKSGRIANLQPFPFVREGGEKMCIRRRDIDVINNWLKTNAAWRWSVYTCHMRWK